MTTHQLTWQDKLVEIIENTDISLLSEGDIVRAYIDKKEIGNLMFIRKHYGGALLVFAHKTKSDNPEITKYSLVLDRIDSFLPYNRGMRFNPSRTSKSPIKEDSDEYKEIKARMEALGL